MGITHNCIEFSEIDKSDSILDKIKENLSRFFNLELSKLSFQFCPIVGLTTLGKHVFKFLFLLSVYTSWFIIFSFILCSSVWRQYKGRLDTEGNGKLVIFKLKLVTGFIEIIKYTYSGFCDFIFTSLVCIKLGQKYVWWYDGTNTCLENWQILTIIFTVAYAIPFPFVLLLGMKMIRQHLIGANIFIFSCLCPVVGICLMLQRKIGEEQRLKYESPPVVNLILSVLQGPYKGSENETSMYWEAMVSVRRLLIISMTLISYESIRMVAITGLCIIFLAQHVCMYPFKVKSSNQCEMISLMLLTFAAVINLLKALQILVLFPQGHLYPFLKGWNLLKSS